MPAVPDAMLLRPPTTTSPEEWRTRAMCRDEDPELFFPPGDGVASRAQAEKAKAVCHRCPVATTCLDWAVKSRQLYGVWGGLSEQDRAPLMSSGRRRQVPLTSNTGRPTRRVDGVALLAAGWSTVDVAAVVGVSEETVGRWRREDLTALIAAQDEL